MGVDVQTEVLIKRPASVVADFVCDPMNAPAWYENIREAIWVTLPGVRVGARASFVAQFLGRRLKYTYEFVDYAPGRRLIMSTAQGPFPMTTEYRFEPSGSSGESTRVTLRNHGEPSGFSKWLSPLLVRAMRRANRKDLAVLKKLLESGVEIGVPA